MKRRPKRSAAHGKAPLDFGLAARQMMRALRGKRSQLAFARRLGYRGNPVADWEAGRRAPTVRRTLRACTAANVDVRAAFAGFHAAEPPDPDDQHSLAAWLERIRGKTSIATLASQSGYSRHQLGRWLSAHAEPRLPEFLATVEAMTGRVSDLVAALVPIELVAELHPVHARREAARKLAYEEPWTEAILRVIEAQSYSALPKHVPGFIADLLGIDRAIEERCLRKLLSAGVIRNTAGRYRPFGSLTVDTRSTAALKAHWTRTALERVTQPGADDFFGYNVFSASHEDMARIRELLRATYREIRTILAATRADEDVALINLQLLCWPRSD
ncbi:MAG TPA: DUF4423 domain-containing protein [Polyangiales bacterium]|nr:DUF4423 domain-containing protein [Polyangiales bacterium]